MIPSPVSPAGLGLTRIWPCRRQKEDLVSLRHILSRHIIKGYLQLASHEKRELCRADRLHIFKQIVEFVEAAHSQGVILGNVRPSSFLLSPATKVSFIDSGTSNSTSDSSDHSSEDDRNSDADDAEGVNQQDGREEQSVNVSEVHSETLTHLLSSRDHTVGTSQLPSNSPDHFSTCSSDASDDISSSNEEEEALDGLENQFPLKRINMLEQTFYVSPEESSSKTSSVATDIFCLGLLLFELFCSVESEAEWSRAMGDLRHRLLPPKMLLEHPKEASLCLLMLHHDPDVRPKAWDILGGDLLSEVVSDLEERQMLIGVEEKESQSELTLDFLLQLQLQKLEEEERIIGDLERVTSDINEVERKRSLLGKLSVKNESDTKIDKFSVDRSVIRECQAATLGKRPRLQEFFCRDSRNSDQTSNGSRIDLSVSDASFAICDSKTVMSGKRPCLQEHSFKDTALTRNESREDVLLTKQAHVMNKFDLLKHVYLSMNPLRDCSATNVTRTSPEGVSLESSKERLHLCPKEVENEKRKLSITLPERLGCFYDRICDYTRYSKLKLKATLQHGDLLNVVSSLGFDRDEEFFAAAAFYRGIKIFECDALLNQHVGIHYPVVELPSPVKVSCVCWNSYFKNHLASSDLEGAVQLWDVEKRHIVSELKEHVSRAWSVDFCRTEPSKLASGSDDGSVKLWSINQDKSVGTIRSSANVCGVQFSRESSHLLAFGSADNRVHYYDLRITRLPIQTFSGHEKAVSFVRFITPTTIVSASTDNTVKIWDTAKKGMESDGRNACMSTLSGHMNKKNFVGLSVSDSGYIACGSETNEVFVYHKSLPMPVMSQKIGLIDPLSGQEFEDDSRTFVSSVCWRGKSQTLLAANSGGNIKVLEMV